MKFDTENIKQGWSGESAIRNILSRYHVHYLQADLMVKTKNGWQIWEVKRQEPFKAPPFDGHGLPKWQIDSRLEFQRDTGIRAVLLVVDSLSNIIYWQYMDELVKCPSFQTTGEKPRVIFPLESYHIYDEARQSYYRG